MRELAGVVFAAAGVLIVVFRQFVVRESRLGPRRPSSSSRPVDKFYIAATVVVGVVMATVGVVVALGYI
jgi:hypothetical protein